MFRPRLGWKAVWSKEETRRPQLLTEAMAGTHRRRSGRLARGVAAPIG